MARKPLDQLSPAYRRRLERAQEKARRSGVEFDRKAARGHAKTPERPSRAQRHPDLYPDYISTRNQLARQVASRKERIWGTVHKYNVNRGNGNIRAIPSVGSEGTMNSNAGHSPTIAAMRKFMAMSDSEAEAWASTVGRLASHGDHSQQDFYFMFYH
jgi:hypothetical protein